MWKFNAPADNYGAGYILGNCDQHGTGYGAGSGEDVTKGDGFGGGGAPGNIASDFTQQFNGSGRSCGMCHDGFSVFCEGRATGGGDLIFPFDGIGEPDGSVRPRHP